MLLFSKRTFVLHHNIFY